jgi:hypothetical protein
MDNDVFVQCKIPRNHMISQLIINAWEDVKSKLLRSVNNERNHMISQLMINAWEDVKSKLLRSVHNDIFTCRIPRNYMISQLMINAWEDMNY